MKEKIILIIENDFLNRRLTKKILNEHGYIVKEAKNAAEAFFVLDTEHVDFVFLDINLGQQEKDGIELGFELMSKYSIPFSYLTAYENKDIIQRAVLSCPYSYISKPFKVADLVTTIPLAIRQHNTKNRVCTKHITVRDGNFKVSLSTENIYYIEAQKNYLLLHTAASVFKTRSTVKQIIEELPSEQFLQIHRAFVINKTKVECYNNKNIIINKIAIPVSKNYVSNILHCLPL